MVRAATSSRSSARNVRQRLRAQVAFAMMAHGNRARLGFLAAHHGHVGNLLHLRIANLGLQFFVAVVQRGANPGGAKLRRDGLGVIA